MAGILIGRVALSNNYAPRQPRPVSFTTRNVKSTFSSIVTGISTLAQIFWLLDYGLWWHGRWFTRRTAHGGSE
jgi:hypothetical protein